jgi:hypothetical protein
VPVFPGQKLALLVLSNDPRVPLERGYLWAQSNVTNADVYPAGQSFKWENPPGTRWERFGLDNGFRTLVDVPEPATLPTLLAPALAAVLTRPRRRSRG